MMADLQHIDITDRAVTHKLFEHFLLGITGKKRRKPLAACQYHHTGLVLASTLNRPLWPKHPKRERTQPYLISRNDLACVCPHAVKHIKDLVAAA